MHKAQLLRPPRSLRGRLIAVLALVLTAGLAGAGVATVLLVGHVLGGRLDDQLRSAGSRFAVSLEHADRDADDGGGHFGQVLGQPVGTLGARMAGGRVTAAEIVGDRQNSVQVPATARARLAGFTGPTGPLTVDLPGVGSYRILITAGRDNDLQVTGLPTAPIEHTISRLALVVVGVFAATLLALVVVSAVLVRVMLRPLQRISVTAADVAELPLGSGGVSLPHRVEEGAAGSEIDVLAKAFNAMLAQVESALQTRADSQDQLRRFIADASHELRTPISVVRSHAELARREGGDDLPENLARSLDRIGAQSERMGRLVEDLLLLARIDSGRPLARESVDLVRLALDAVDDARAAYPGHLWRLALPEDPVTVSGDGHALAQVLSNLLANVAAHTPGGTSATVRVSRGDSGVDLDVTDNGPGLPPQLSERAFDRFVRGDGTRTVTRGGSGLGLPIVAAIVAAHSGAVSLAASPAGTTVSIRLPGESGAVPGSVPGS